MSVSMDVSIADAASGPLGALVARLEDKSPLMAILANLLRNSTVERFRTQKSPDGVTWKPSLRAKLTGGQTLVQSGIFRDSTTKAHGEDFAQVGTNDPRARALTLGATIVPKTKKALAFNLPGIGFRMASKVVLPARPLYGLSSQDRDDIRADVTDYIAEPMLQAGGFS